jgi:hypothetical protein
MVEGAGGAGPLRVLCLDCGAPNGLFSAAVLEQLEGDLAARLVEHCDLVAGTSRDGPIALAYGRGPVPGGQAGRLCQPGSTGLGAAA